MSANTQIRDQLTTMTEKEGVIYFPRLEFCTDNGAMIAYAGYQRFVSGYAQGIEIFARPRWPMSEL